MDVMYLFHRYRDDVYRLAVSYTRNTAEAEDVCQTVFLKLLENPYLDENKLTAEFANDFYGKAGLQYAAILSQPTFFCECDSRPGQSSQFCQILHIPKMSLRHNRALLGISYACIQF